MSITAVYSLVSNKYDRYTEQVLLSVTSLRTHNPGMPVVVFTDEHTVKYKDEETMYALGKIADIRVTDIPNGFNKLERSRYIKTNCRHWIDGDMLFVDSDTLVVGDISSLSDLDNDIYMCGEDTQTTINETVLYQLRLLGVDNGKHYYNSGVIYCRDNANIRNFYGLWYNKWLYTKNFLGTHRDQPSLAMVNLQLDYVSDLDISYNTMTLTHDSIKSAKIIHYCSVGHTLDLDKCIFSNVVCDGFVPLEKIKGLYNAILSISEK